MGPVRRTRRPAHRPEDEPIGVPAIQVRLLPLACEALGECAAESIGRAGDEDDTMGYCMPMRIYPDTPNERGSAVARGRAL